jgi:membrane associated rhomboid family serine protease
MSQDIYSRRPSSSIPNVIFALLIANGLVFALQQLNAEFMFINFALWPATDPRSPFMPWQLFTYGFLHGNTTHIFFNMFGLWMFGRDIELFMGSRRFLVYYLEILSLAVITVLF